MFCLDFPPLEYIPTKPPHSTYVIIYLLRKRKIIDVYINKGFDTICILSKNAYFMLWHNLYFNSKYIAAPLNIKKYKTIIYDVSGMRSYS